MPMLQLGAEKSDCFIAAFKFTEPQMFYVSLTQSIKSLYQDVYLFDI